MRSLVAREELLLVGNPNAGKSTVFNKLTGGHAKVGNWHGVTVGALSRSTSLGGTEVTVSDLPGIYSAEGGLEERAACDYIRTHADASVIFVAECATLPRALPLFYKLSQHRRCALLLTKKRQFERSGGFLREEELSRTLGVPVLLAEGKSGKRLRAELGALLPLPLARVGRSAGDCYRAPAAKLSRTDKLLINPLFALPLFAAALLFAFFVTFAPGMPGEVLKRLVEGFFTETLSAPARNIPSPVLRGFVADGLLKSLGGVFCFLPQILLLFFFLTLMEESGLLSRLAMLADGVFSRLGLNGRAVFPLLMGFGCSAAAILTTRALDDKRIQRRVILLLPYISCSAKLPVYLTLASSFFDNPFPAVILLYALGVGLAFAVALFLKEPSPPFAMELAPLQIPSPLFVAKALFFQLRQFIIKLGTVILAFFLFSWLLSSFSWDFTYCAAEKSMLAGICGGLKYLFAPIGCCDWKIAYAALSGLVAKENVAGALAMFYGGFPYPAASAFAFSVFLLACSPCVSAIAASARELGWRSAIRNALVQTASALLLSYLVYFLLTGGGVYALFALPPLAALFILGKKGIEKIRRRRTRFAQKLHR